MPASARPRPAPRHTIRSLAKRLVAVTALLALASPASAQINIGGKNGVNIGGKPPSGPPKWTPPPVSPPKVGGALGQIGGAISNGGKQAGGAISSGGKQAGGVISSGGKVLGQQASSAGKVLGQQASSGTKILGQQASSAGKVLGQQASSGTKILGQQASSAGKVLGQQASSGTKILGQQASSAGKVLGGQASSAGKVLGGQASSAGKVLGGQASNATKITLNTLGQAGGAVSNAGKQTGGAIASGGKVLGGQIASGGKVIGGQAANAGKITLNTLGQAGGQAAAGGKVLGGQIASGGKVLGGDLAAGGKIAGGLAAQAGKDTLMGIGAGVVGGVQAVTDTVGKFKPFKIYPDYTVITDPTPPGGVGPNTGPGGKPNNNTGGDIILDDTVVVAPNGSNKPPVGPNGPGGNVVIIPVDLLGGLGGLIVPPGGGGVAPPVVVDPNPPVVVVPPQVVDPGFTPPVVVPAPEPSPNVLGVADDTQATAATAMLVTDLDAGPGADGGLQKGDIILKIDGTRTRTFADLRAALTASPGQSRFMVYRPSTSDLGAVFVAPVEGRIGASVEETPVDVDEASLDAPAAPEPAADTAVVITDLDPGPAATAGLLKGDIIIKVDGTRTKTFADLRTVLTAGSGKSEFLFFRPSAGQVMARTVAPIEGRIGASVEETPVDLDDSPPAGNDPFNSGPPIEPGKTTAAPAGPTALQVAEVGRGGAGRAGIVIGDVILSVDGKRVSTPADLGAALKASSGESAILVFNPDEKKAETKKVKVVDGSVGVGVRVVGLSAN